MSVRARTRIDDRVYVIGWQQVPPFQQKTADNSPAGLAVDLIRDAARRQGIRLQWKWYPGSSEAALKNREVDLWPLITATPERLRQKAIYITDPYLRHDHNLIVLSRSGYTQVADLKTASISFAELPINRQLLHRVLPDARPVPAASVTDAVENVCAGRADAVFLDDFSTGNLASHGSSCLSQPLRVIALPLLRTSLGVGSTPETSAVADLIRHGIDTAALEGELSAILKNGGYYSPRNLEYFSALLEAKRRERWLLGAIVLFAGMAGFIAFEAHRIRRQRDRILQTREALQRSEEKLRLMANNLSGVVLAYDMTRRLVFANPGVERLTGYSVEELERGDPLYWVHPDDRLPLQSRWDNLFRGDSYRNEEYRLVTKDGDIRWMVASWAPIYDGSGRQVGVQGSERDVTERKVAERALLEYERRFRQLLEDVQLVALITDDKGAITFCNDYTLSLTGWRRDELVGRSADEIVSSALPQAESHILPHSEGAILEKNGGRRCIHWSSTLLRSPDGRFAGFASLGEDVTEVQALRLQAAQQESEERFRNTADTAPLMIWQAAADMSCTFVNKGWLRFTGRSIEQELGTGWTANVHPDDLQLAVATFQAAFHTRHDFQFEFRKRRADGEYRWVLCNGVTRFGLDGAFAGYVGTCSDITDMKREREADAGREKLQTLSRLATGVAHDFNNVLGGVLSQADLALQELADGQLADEQLRRIRELALRGAEAVRQLMTYAGQDNAVCEPLNLSFLIAGMSDELRAIVGDRALMTTELDPDLPRVHANPSQLRQLVVNLVTNAFDAIPERFGLITLRTQFRNGTVVLEVSDSGAGIAPEHQPRIFEPFFTTRETGRGLGLAVAHGIVQGLGGTIECESELGRGSAFRIVLPCQGDAPVPASRSEVQDATGGPSTVLVVEDEEPIRVAAAKVLRKSNLSVLEAADGSSALDLLREHYGSIRLILLDITLPGAPSREVFAEARRLNSDIRIVVTSAYGPQKASECFPGLKIDAFVAKPYRLSELVSLLQTVLDTRARC
jgi:PAS domain S-box-containing protein